MKDNKNTLAFAAINPYIKTNIISPTEQNKNNGFVEFGDGNKYPSYLWDLYSNASTLQSIINGTVDYVCGDDIESSIATLSTKKAKDLVRNIAMDLLIYGGTYIQVRRNGFGGVAEVDTLDYRKMRTNKDNSLFYYSEDFINKSYGRCKCTIYEAFNNGPTSVYYVKNNKHQVYPIPMWSSAVIAAEIERNVNQYHLNSLDNGFAPNVIVTFCNGIPSDEIREEIEKSFNEKFSGYQNAGRTILNWADSKEHSTDIQSISADDFGDRYNTLVERSKDEIFVSFRATPNLFGLPNKTTGFNSQEYEGAFKLYQKTVVQPIQSKICDIINDIYEVEDGITITPFTINFE